MYVHKGKRKFFVTIREVREDNALGESESFSVYESDIKMSREELSEYLINAINKTHKGEKL
jgi:hypothetical protein